MLYSGKKIRAMRDKTKKILVKWSFPYYGDVLNQMLVIEGVSRSV
jgi:hypothetical protein